MRVLKIVGLSLLTVPLFAQNVVQNPTTSQTITQPAGTSFSVQGVTSLQQLDGVMFANQFIGSDICQKINNAIAVVPNGGTVFAQLGATTNTCTTGTISVPAGVRLQFDAGTLSSNGCPVISLNGLGSSVSGIAAEGTLITGTGAGCNVINFAGGANTGFAYAENLRINSTGSNSHCVAIQDNGRNLTLRKLHIGACGGEGIRIVPGSYGGLFYEFDQVRVEQATDVGFDFNLGTNANVTTIQVTNSYANATVQHDPNTPSRGFDLQRVQATFSSTAAENNGIGWRVAGDNALYGNIAWINDDSERNTTGILIQGNGEYFIEGTAHSNDVTPIQATAANADIYIIAPSTTGSGSNSIVYSGAANGSGHHLLIGNRGLDKPVSGITDEILLGKSILTGPIGINASPFSSTLELNEYGSVDTRIAFDRNGGNSNFLANEGSAGSNCSGSAQDDLCFRLLNHTLHVSTNNGASDALTVDSSGNTTVHGTLYKSAGSFKIDHPLDPANKYLYHSFVESADMKNIYDGVVTLNSNGEAEVQMPDWFQALNEDFRYQLTPIGGPAQVYIARKMHNNRFGIAGGLPGMEVSWQVTGIRHDAYANANRVPVEEEKGPALRGTYMHPELFPTAAGSSAAKSKAFSSLNPSSDYGLSRK